MTGLLDLLLGDLLSYDPSVWLAWYEFVNTPFYPEGLMLTCVYCGHAYPEGTPASGAEIAVLTEHIKVCDRHPMRALREALILANERYRIALAKADHFPAPEDEHALDVIEKALR